MPTGPLYATLTKAARHRRLSLSARWLLLAGAALPLALTAACVADNLFNLPAAARAMIALLLAVALPGALLALYLRYWRLPPDLAKTAVFLEQRHGIDDNRLINAVHFDRDPNLPSFLKSLFTHQAESACRSLDLRLVWRHARLTPALRICLVGLILSLAYAVPFGRHARNAFQRLLRPSSDVAPLNFTQFAVAPGDIRLPEGQTCTVRAAALKHGRPAARLEILVRTDGAPLLYPMRPDDDRHAFVLTDLGRDTRYAIRNGRDLSRWYTVSVLPRPRLDRLTVTVTPPAYTGAEPFPLNPFTREADAPQGARVTVRANAAAHAPALRFLRDGQPAQADGGILELTLLEDTTLAIDGHEADGTVHAGLWQCRLRARPDTPPEARLLNRELNLRAAPGQTLPLTVGQRDDFGLAALELFVRGEQGETVLKRITYRDRRRDRQEAIPLTLSADRFAPNATYKIWARVFDNREPAQCGVSPTPLTLHVAAPSKDTPSGPADDPHIRLFAALSEALRQQSETRDWLASRIESDRQERVANSLHKRQESVHERVATGAVLAESLCRTNRLKRSFADSVETVRGKLSAPLLRHIPSVAALPDEPRKAALNDVVLRQTALAHALQLLLGTLANERALDTRQQQQLAEEQQDQTFFDKLQKLKDDLAKFQEEQRRIMADTEAIDKKNPEDWTEAEEKLLGDLAARQQEWAKLFRAAFNDLSKVENQDFSNSFMADELVEMIEELQKSGAALEKKHIEIATVNEELLGEQAASIETNLERWLSDAKDHIRWNGEEGGLSPDVPLQDLPAELTDIIGELIDQAEEMEDVEDSTNSSLSAFDKGIGWGVSDGNMDDMSAKGITGNILPNNNEVGGRSGEGRSGKSSGQFVEQEATGKGGRDTPTRLVQSPFEKGTVKDSSKDPQGGATGGGKQSGVGGEGLRGITPDQKPDVQQRLPGQQAELKQKAESLLRELTVRNLPTADLEEAVNKMELIQRANPSGEGLQLRQVRNEMLASLRDARTALATGAAAAGEARAASARSVSTIRALSHETAPDGYETSVDAYFRALAEPDAE